MESKPRELGVTSQIVGIVFFNFIGYLTIGIPLAVLPSYVQRLGYGPVLAGLAISVQYIATFLSRAAVGRLSDSRGPKQAVLLGLFFCGLSGVFLLGTEALQSRPLYSLCTLFAGRLVLGCGESFVTTGAIMWGIGRLGIQHTARVISWNGVTTYGALAIGAPLGIYLEQLFGFTSIGLSVMLLAWLSFPFAWVKQPSIPKPGKPIPMHKVFGRILPYGIGLALGSLGFGSIATFITLYYSAHQWSDAAFSLTTFGIFFVGVRLLFGHFIDRFGGYRVAMVSFVLEAAGLVILGAAGGVPVAMLGATLTGIGFSLIFPSLGVEAIGRVSEDNRGAALAMYSVFVDVALLLTGPVGGLVASHWGFRMVFLVASIAAMLGIALTGSIYFIQPRTRLAERPL